MNSLLLLHCYLFLIGYTLASNDGNCNIEGLTNEDYLTRYSLSINDTQINTNILESAYTGNLAVDSCTSSSGDLHLSFFNVTSDATNFLITTTEAFANFDNTTNKQTNTIALVTLQCTLVCVGISTLTIQISVTDINSHAPQFNLAEYEYKVATPIMPLTDFTIYGSEVISVTDIDFSNQAVTFTVEPDDFSISATTSSSSKKYTAVFSANNVVQLIGNRTYTITATDSGTIPGTLSSTATLTLIVDEAKSLDIPSFDSASYSFNYTVVDTTPTLTANDDEPITIDTNKPASLSNVELTGTYSDYFTATLNQDSRTIVLAVRNGLLPTDIGSFVVLTLSVSTDNRASTTIIVYPTGINDVPQFSSHYYTGSYSDVNNNVTLDNPIVIASVRAPDVNISGEYADHFSVTYDEASASCIISVSSNLTLSEIKLQSYITLTLEASLGENSDTAVLLLSLPEHTLQFTQAVYNASYNSDNSVTVDKSSPIGFTTDDANVEISVDATYADNFAVTYNTLEKEWKVAVNKPLDNDVLRAQKSIVITLTASDLYNNTAQSILNIYLPSSSAPEFSNSVYVGNYSSNGNISTITLDNNIVISNVDNPEDVTITLDSYMENFAISYDNTEASWKLTVILPLPQEKLLSSKVLAITLTAAANNDNIGQAMLILILENKDAPQFTQTYYLATYPESETGTIELDDPIGFTNIEDPTNIVISLDSFTDNFEITYASNNTWTIALSKGLDQSDLSKNVELVIVLTATETGNENEAQAVLVIELPVDNKAPKFTEAYYIADYPDNGTGIIEFQKPISFTNADDPTTIEITMDNYSENFEIVHQSDMWYINIKKSLETNIVAKNAELVMTLIATETGKNIEGYSALVLKLPAIDKAPEFTEAYYIAEYPKNGNGTLQLERAIDFLNVDDISTVTITLDNYTNNFEINFTANIWTINIKNALEEGVLIKETDLVITLTATQTDNSNSGRSALVLKLPARELAPVFSESYYQATYTLIEGQASVVFAHPINITNKEDLSKIVITVDNYQENFNIVYNADSNIWIMNVTNELSDTILLSKTDIVIALTATDTNNDLVGRSVVYLNLPSLNTDESPRFSKTYYTANYKISGETAFVTFDAPINITNRDDLTGVSIGIDNYAENFRITYDKSSNVWTMNVIKNLDEAVLNTKVDLVMAVIASENSSNIAQAALVLTLPLVNNDEAPKFSRIYYSGEYITDGTIDLENSIEIVNKVNLTKVVINFDDIYRDNFEIIYDTGTSKWILNVKTLLTESILNTTPDIVLTLTATEEGNDTNIGQAALVLHLPLEKVKVAPKFSLAHYFARYELNDDMPSIVLNNSITVINKDLTNISVVLDSYDAYFNVNYNSSAKQWTIAIAEPLPDEVLNSTSELVLTMIARETDNDNTGESTLILELSHLYSLLKFSQVHYTANYSIAETSVTMNDKIEVVGQSTSDLTVSLESNEYSGYFRISQEGDNYIVSVQSAIPSEILDSQVSLVMTLVATVDSSSSYATLVINLPVAVTGRDIEFTQTLYTASYEIIDGKANFQVNGTIQVQTDEEDANIESGIFSEIGYQSYFQISYSSKVVTVALSIELPENVLRENAFIPLILTVGVSGTTSVSSAVLNIAINYNEQGNSTSIEFSSVLYQGKYEVTNGQPILTIEEQIAVVTDEADSNIEVNLTSVSGYEEYFKKTYANKQITIEISQELPESLLRQNRVIPLILSVGITGTAWRSSAVLNIQIVYNDGGNSTALIEFSNILFNGKYEVTDGTGALIIEDQISVVTDEPDSTVAVTITNEYESFFTLTYLNKVVTIELAQQLTSDTLTSNTFIPLTLQAAITGTSSQSTAVVNIRIRYDSENDTGSIEFGAVLYTGEYTVRDGNGVLNLHEAIRVITDVADDEIETSISNYAGYNEFFTISYSNHIISVGLNGNLPSNDNTFIALTLTVGIKETTHRSTSVLNIEINREDDGNDSCENVHAKTAYISVIVILCILLLVLIIAVAAFYWFKLRDRGYENFEDDDGTGKVRFDKNTIQRPSTDNKPSTIEGRRATGFIFNPISEDNMEAVNDVNFSNTGSVHDTEKTRRKSVAFDDNVEKLQIDPVNDEDIVSDDNLDENTEVTHI